MKSETPNTLQDERHQTDSDLGAERLKIDEANIMENNEQEKESLRTERSKTDKSLSNERITTDTQSDGFLKSLSMERSSHDTTKNVLTSRDEFLAIVTHDLRSPIGSILSYAELLLDEVLINNGEGKAWMEVIKRNAETSLRLISDILDMERFAKGKLSLNLAKCNINELVLENVQTFSAIAFERKIKLTKDLSQEIPPVSFDRDRIGQVLGNLISNALKFTPKNGSVTIKTAHVDDDICVSVTDTGPGVPDEQKKRIFERSTQLVKSDQRGLGLGLYISTTLVEAHQGKLGIKSKVGSGSTFFFNLPINRFVTHCDS